MDFDTYTVALLVLREDAPEMDEAALDALQDAHLAHLAKLHEEGHLLAAGPALGAPDRRIRGFSIFRAGPEETRALVDEDPAVRAGRFDHEIFPWMVPRGAAHFTRTRFPHSAAEAGAPSEPAKAPGPAGGADGPDLMPLIFGFRTTQALYVVAKLGVADLLADGPKTAEELAPALGVQPRPLFRVMRALAATGVFTQDAQDRFALTALGERLRDGHPRSLRHLAIFAAEHQYRAMGELLHTVRTGETAFNHLYGMGHFDYLDRHPDASATFNRAMAEGAAQWRDPEGLYDLPERRLVVDVGGGRGHLLAAILEANPSLRGILYDLPAGVREAPAYLASRGVADRCEIRTGSAFESVPQGGDVYILSRVLHDWPDEPARILLANCRKAIADGGVLLLREAIVPPGDAPSFSKQTDLTMLALLGGAERTEAEWRSLLASTRFGLTRITRTDGRFDLIEAKPV